jgi:hypothetical protein
MSTLSRIFMIAGGWRTEERSKTSNQPIRACFVLCFYLKKIYCQLWHLIEIFLIHSFP